jgi:TolB-like protein/class 3 adenylate cyclase
MVREGADRRLAAILAADVVGYSRLMAADEEGTLARLRAVRAERIDPTVAKHHGRIVKLMGDGALVEFASIVDAVRCAVDVQRRMAEHEAELPEDQRIRFRIGVNLGDVIIEGNDIYGDGVNVAARLEGLAEPGGIVISGTAFDHAKKAEAGFRYIGRQQIKNIPEPVRAYQVLLDPAAVGSVVDEKAPAAPRWRLHALAAAVALLIIGAGLVGWLRPWEAAAPDPATQTIGARPAIAVLPFADLTGSSDRSYFAYGLTEDIITRLSRFQDLKAIGRNSTMQYEGRPVDAREVGRDLGVQFVVEGSVRRDQDTLRISANLIDARDGSHVWAENYDRPATVENLFAIQDDVTEQIVATIADSYGVISRRMAKEYNARPPKDWDAYQCVLRYYEYADTNKPESLRRSIECSERATAADPAYADAWGFLAEHYADVFVLGFDFVPDPLDRALTAGLKGVQADPMSQQAHWGLAYAYFHRGERQLFKEEAKVALELNPNRAYIVGYLGWALAHAGEWDQGTALIARAYELNPRGPTFWLFPVAWNHYRLGDYERALLVANKIKMPDFYWDPLMHAAILGQLGRTKEAKAALADALALQPDLREKIREYVIPWFVEPELVERILDGLRKAGLEVPPPAYSAGVSR